MIQVCLSWIYISLWFYVEGDLFARLLHRQFARGQEAPHFPALLKIPLGIAFLILQLSLIHFFLPLNWVVHLALGAILLPYVLWMFKERGRNRKISWAGLGQELQNNRLFWLLFSAIVLLFAYAATDYPFYNRDNGRYHFQALLWAKEFPLVPGLANLHDRLGSNSAWYLVQAFFDQFWMSRKVFHVLNPFLILYLFVVSLSFTLRGKRRPGYSNLLVPAAGAVTFIFLALNFKFIFIWLFQGVTPDTAVHFFIICFLLFLVFSYEQKWFEKAPAYAAAILVIYIFSAYSVRINGLFMVLSLLPLAALLLKYQALSVRNVVGLAVLGGLFAVVVIARNLLLSGYPLFPSQYFDIFSFDWKLPKEIAYYSSLGVLNSNDSLDQFTSLTAINYSGLLDSSRLAVMKNIFINDLKSREILLFNLIAALGLVGYWLSAQIKQRKIDWSLSSFALVFLGQLGICYLSGPIPRYGFGYNAIALILPVVLIIQEPLKRLSPSRLYRWGLAALLLLLVPLFLYRQAIPVSVRAVRLGYPRQVAREFVRNLTTFPALVHGKQRPLVVNEKLTVNLSEFEDSYLQLARFPTHIFRYPGVPAIEVIDQVKGHRDHQQYNAFVATMNWMDPLPSVGAIYRGLTLRGQGLREGFKIGPAGKMRARRPAPNAVLGGSGPAPE